MIVWFILTSHDKLHVEKSQKESLPCLNSKVYTTCELY